MPDPDTTVTNAVTTAAEGRLSAELDVFYNRRQLAGESFDAFYAALLQLLPTSASPAASTGTGERERLLRSAIVLGIREPSTRAQLERIGGPDLTLANAVALCRMADVLQVARTAGDEPVVGAAVAVGVGESNGKASMATTMASTEAIIVENPFAMQPKHMCGITGWHPRWLQQFANTKSFLVVYGLLGTVQSMAFIYFVVTLSTVEKRFKIPSYMTGIIISGNEISQILLSLVLSYAGGQRNRPRWIAWGVVFCALSCFILASPHLIYGPGDDALHLTAEWLQQSSTNSSLSSSSSSSSLSLNQSTIPTQQPFIKSANKLCTGTEATDECDEHFSYVPLVLIFLSQFVLGIGTTLYYTLGNTYLDDNTRKTNTPMMLAYAMSLRMFGPVVGFLLGFATLRMYIDPWRTPLITRQDPRWLGAWWLGWILLGFAMLLFSWLIGMFPKELPKLRLERQQSEALEERPRFMRPMPGGGGGDGGEDNQDAEEAPFHGSQTSAAGSKPKPQLRDLPAALMRLLRNKLLMFNILSGIFYILGASGTITFLSKYMEVQFNKNASDATVITGPVSLMAMVTGFLISGWAIGRYQPGPRKLFFWNVIIGMCIMGGQFANLYLTCDTGSQLAVPVAVRSGAASWTEAGVGSAPLAAWNLTSSCNAGCACDRVPYSPVCDERTGTTFFSPCHAGCARWDDGGKRYDGCACGGVTTATSDKKSLAYGGEEYVDGTDYDFEDVRYHGEVRANWTRQIGGGAGGGGGDRVMLPGACMAGCAMAFYLYSGLACVINWLGATGRIGNILLNFRCVSVADKSFSQGLVLMMISLFALIPGPILYGYIIDNACLLWNSKCGQRGNCQLYDATQFRYYLNLTAMALTAVGVFFDVLVWWYGKDVDLYGDREAEAREKAVAANGDFRRRHQPISPLMAKK